MILAATGHRPNKLNNEYNGGPVSEWIREKFHDLFDSFVYMPEKIISGMALGVDTIWAKFGLEVGVPVLAAIPFEGQEKAWPKSSQNQYWEILNNPRVSKYIVCDTGYASWKMQKRNIWMVDNCDKLVAVWDGSSGGTGNCVKYAESAGKEIIRINPRKYK